MMQQMMNQGFTKRGDRANHKAAPTYYLGHFPKQMSEKKKTIRPTWNMSLKSTDDHEFC